MPLSAIQLIYLYSFKQKKSIGSETDAYKYLVESRGNKKSPGPLSFHLSAVSSPGLLPRYVKYTGSTNSRLTIYYVKAPEEKVCFFPKGFFFPSGFFRNSEIGFHWVEAMTNARVVNAFTERPVHAHLRSGLVVGVMGERGGETSVRSISRPQTKNGERWFPKGDTVHSSVNEGEQTKTIKDCFLFTLVKPLISSTSSTNDFALLFRDKTEAARGEFLYFTTSHSYLLISARILLFLPVTMDD